MKKYDVIVIGAGHAGIESSFVCARLGMETLLITLNLDMIGHTSCNPAVGGVAKGHLVREIDAMGGIMARIADYSAIQYRRLNRSKGQCVWSTRCQVDRFLYRKFARKFLEEEKNLFFFQAEVREIMVEDKRVKGVVTDRGEFYSKAVILCPGTFPGGKIHLGLESFPGGRLGEKASLDLVDNLGSLGFVLKSFKTGTCARLDSRTIDYSRMVPQYSEEDVEPFSSEVKTRMNRQVPCFITYTNKDTHEIILQNMDRSPLYTGVIQSTGVRYCPSLEDKIVKFQDKERHQVFIEPEGLDTAEVYPNGISTSLPLDVQEDFIHTIEGLEKAKILRPGYGIEHVVIDARQLTHALQARHIEGLFVAGQINGTTGYEEAASQGLAAGINASLKIKGEEEFVFERTSSYTGVLIDDLVTKGTDEPYRMFTSRSELRFVLRESNADLRLSGCAHRIGLLSDDKLREVKKKEELISRKLEELKSVKVYPRSPEADLLEERCGVQINDIHTSASLLKRPQVSLRDLDSCGLTGSGCGDLSSFSVREVEIEIKYEGFVKREIQEAKSLNHLNNLEIPVSLDIDGISGISNEIKFKIRQHNAKTLGQVKQIPGVTPASVILLAYHIRRHRGLFEADESKAGSPSSRKGCII